MRDESRDLGFPITRSPEHPITRFPLCVSAVIQSSAVHEVLLYTRAGCHLCDEVKATLARLAPRGAFTWKEVDIDSDPALQRQFNEEVPVVFIDGRKAFKYRMSERDFLRLLKAR